MRFLRRTARAALVGLSTLAFTTACSDGTGTVELPGTYQLAAINDEPLPWLVSESSTETEEIVRGWVDLDESGRFSDVTVYRISGPGIVPQEDIEEFTGDYEMNGDEIIFYEDQGGTYTMARNGNDISQTITTTNGSSFTFRYTK